MTQYDPNDPLRPTGAVITETVETVVVRESNTGWWIAGILGGLVLLAIIWILSRPDQPDDSALLAAQAEAEAAQAQSDQALVSGQIAGAQASVEIARAEAARSQADAIRASSDARAAEARSASPVIIEREVRVPTPAPAPEPAVVSPTTPQN